MEAVAVVETVGTDAMKLLYVYNPFPDNSLVYHLIGSVFPFEFFKSIHARKPGALICGVLQVVTNSCLIMAVYLYLSSYGMGCSLLLITYALNLA